MGELMQAEECKRASRCQLLVLGVAAVGVYWLLLGACRCVLIGLNAFYGNVVYTFDFPISVRFTVREWFSPELVLEVLLVAILLPLCLRLNEDRQRRERRSLLLLLWILVGPAVSCFFLSFIVVPMTYGSWISRILGPYCDSGPRGSAAACVGLASTVVMVPFLALLNRVLQRKWPQYSLRSLVIFVVALGGCIIWSMGYLRLYQQGTWYFDLGPVWKLSQKPVEV